MRRLAVLLAIAGCDEPAADEPAPPRTWVYPPPFTAWPLGTVTGTFGRSQAPQPAARDGIAGDVGVPLRQPTMWAVPGEGAARAVAYGNAGGKQAVELIEIDVGRVVWRDTMGCAGPVVGVTDEVIVCADGRGTRAVGLDGKQRWSTDGATFIAITGERIAIAGEGEAVILDATLGDELSRVKLPAGITSDSIIATCGDAGRELFAYGQDGRLVRIAEAAGGPKATWSVPLDTIAGIEACDGASVLVTVSTTNGTALVALARETGTITGTVTEVRGYWPARDGGDRIEISTVGGVARWSRDLVAPSEHVAILALGELLATRGNQRLVRATPLTAALLDDAGVRSYLPLAQPSAALGEKAIVSASWLGSPGETVHRTRIPARYPRVLRVAGPRPSVAVPAELRDLPALVDAGGAVATSDAGTHAVPAVAMDPLHEGVLYVVAQDRAPDEDVPSALLRFDLRTREFTSRREDGCGPGTVVGLSVARHVVVCAARGTHGSSVRATTRDGAGLLWEWKGANVDGVDAAGELVLVRDGDRAFALDTRDGRVVSAASSDDGAPMRAAVVDVEGMTLLVTAERGRVVARVSAAQMAPAWSLEVHGVVADLAVAGDGVLVALEDGDAYRIDARTGAVVAVPGLDLVWRASAELVTGEAAGGPIPPDKPWLPPPPKAVPRKAAVPERQPGDPPVLPKTWPAPPPMRASWQYTLYEVTGALRTRNDYALVEPITPARTRAARAPILVQSGPGLREVLVLDPERGDPQRRVRLPEDAVPGLAFSVVVDGKPVVGTLLANPLRVVLF